jgi:hypothetical protein
VLLARSGDDDTIDLAMAAVRCRLEAMGLAAAVETDFKALRRLLDAQGACTNPSFDPARSRFGVEDFWLRLTDRRGREVGCSAERVFELVDFTDLLRTGRLWYAEGFAAIGDAGAELPVSLPSRHLGGRVGHGGSTWVHPAWRGRRLAACLTGLGRALSFGTLACDFATGVVRGDGPSPAGGVPRTACGYPHVELAIDGFFPPLQRPERIYLCWLSRAEFVAGARGLRPGRST